MTVSASFPAPYHARHPFAGRAVPRRHLLDVMRAFAKAVEKVEPYTAGHQGATARLAAVLGRKLRFSAASIRLIHLGALLHDVGKIAVPPSLLLRPGPLSPAEFSVIKEHPRIGWEIIGEIEFAQPIATVIYQHHERLDGSGYPNGLADRDILPEAMVVAVADVVHAMMSHRPYRRSMNATAILRALDADRGIRLPADCVDAVSDLISSDQNFWATYLEA